MSIEERIKLNIKLFYQWRNDFVHSAKIPEAFQKFGLHSNDKIKIIFTTAYQRKDFELLFEHGFLRCFGYKNNFIHKDIEKKIMQYKKYTGIKIEWGPIKKW